MCKFKKKWKFRQELATVTLFIFRSLFPGKDIWKVINCQTLNLAEYKNCHWFQNLNAGWHSLTKTWFSPGPTMTRNLPAPSGNISTKNCSVTWRSQQTGNLWSVTRKFCLLAPIGLRELCPPWRVINILSSSLKMLISRNSIILSR